MAAGKRLSLVNQASIVWMLIDDKCDLGHDLTAFVETGTMGSASETMPYNPAVLEAIVEAGLWSK